MGILRRRGPKSRGEQEGSPARGSEAILVVGLGNPGDRYTGTPHNVGFEVTSKLAERWDLKRPREKFRSKLSDGRIRPGGPRVIVVQPLTFMNESGKAVGPARGSLGVGVEKIVVVHDEIDLPFGEVRTRQGGGLAGHRGLKSLDAELGSSDFWRVRVGVGRPDSTEPEQVASYVLGRWRQSKEDVARLIDQAADEAERLVERLAERDPEEAS